MAQRKIQLLRSTTIYESQLLAKQSFTDALATSANLEDGEMLLARYSDGPNGLKSILGVYNKKQDAQTGNLRKGFTLIVDNETVDSLISEISGKITVIESSVGLNNDGTKPNYTGENITEVVNVDDSIVSAIEKIANAIAGMDKSADAVDGQVVTTVSEVNGVVSETKSNVKDLQLGGYSKDANATGAIGSTDTVNTALSKLENSIIASGAANTVSSSDESITVTQSVSGTDVIVNVDGTTIVKDSTTKALKSGLTIAHITSGLNTNIKEAYQLQDANGTQVGAQINIYKDSALLSVALLHADLNANPQLKPTYSDGAWTDIASASQTEDNLALCYAYLDAYGATIVEAVPVGAFLRESEFGDGLQVNGGVVSVKVDTTSEAFLTVSTNGIKLSGVQDAIDDETERAQDAEDELASLIGLTGTEGNRSWTPTTNYGTGAQSARDNMESIATALSGVIATVSGTAYLPSDAISVTQSQETGHEDEFTIALELSAESDNVLEIKNTGNKGAYLSGTWDCGEY